MCGISGGMSSILTQGELTKIKGLMVMSCFRGMYGSGSIVIAPGKKKAPLSILTHKTELCAAELTCEPEFLDAISDRPKIVIAHARAPTKGNNELCNVHPHRSKHITGVHNGTMHRVMDKLIGDESDSAAVFAAIAEHGVSEFVKESRGAYSLVWIDAKDGSLNFLRNDQRPMVFGSMGYSNSISTMYWSSEIGQMKYVLDREHVKFEDVKFESPKPWQHVRFPLDVKNAIYPIDITQYDEPKTKTSVGYDVKNSPWWDSADYDDTQDIVEMALRKPHSSVPMVRPRYESEHRNYNHVNVASMPTVEEILNRRTAPSAHFHGDTESKTKLLLKGGPCCLCDHTPPVKNRNGVTLYPKVYEVRFGNGFPQYICSDCVTSGNPIALSVLDLPPKEVVVLN